MEIEGLMPLPKCVISALIITDLFSYLFDEYFYLCHCFYFFLGIGDQLMQLRGIVILAVTLFSYLKCMNNWGMGKIRDGARSPR